MRSRTVSIGLIADPGLPEALADSVAEHLRQDLSGHLDSSVEWKVEVSEETLPLTADGDIPLLEQAPRLRADHHWDYVFYLTDLPRSHDQQPLACELGSCARAALISLPALGAFRLTARIRALVLALIVSADERSQDFPSMPAIRRAIGSKAVRRELACASGEAAYVTLPGRVNRWRLLTGMVRNNRPWELLRALTSCVAAATATGAFGIFYASIWTMANALHPVRLALISLAVIVALSAWLITHNGLWTASRSLAIPGQARLDNASTAATVIIGVAVMYVVLFLVLLCAAAVIISADYLRSQVGHPAGLLDYIRLSWLAASLGCLAGALGSNFDSDEAIREATYSRRAHRRRQLADS